MKKVFLIVTIILVNFVGNSQNLRANFMKGKTHDQAVKAFNELSGNDQKELWLEKMDQMLSLKLPNEHHNLIKEIKEGISSGVDKSNSQSFFK